MSELSLPTSERRQAYVLLRFVTAIDFFGHGAARIFTGTHLAGFAEGMVKNMASTPLPEALARATGYTVPCVELLIGVLLLAGVATRFALTAALLLMAVLMFGITLKQDWSTAGLQLTYAFILAALLFGRSAYDSSWMQLLRRNASI
jgi:thiosulfate dehydrogenase [quinone] large subunit